MKTKLKYSIQLRLSVAFALISLLAAAAAGGIAFYDTYHETHDLQDSLLRQTATYIRPDTPVTQQDDDDNDAHIFIQTPVTPANQIILPLPENISDGLHTLTHKKDNYRVFIKSTPQGRIAVLQDNEYREDLAVRAAWNSAIPLLALVPLITLLTIIIMRRTLRPVRLLSLSVDHPQQISAVTPRTLHDGWLQGIIQEPSDRFHWNTTRDTAIEYGSQGVDISPGSVAFIARGVLFWRRITGCNQAGHALALAANRRTRRTKIDEDYPLVARPQIQISWFDVAVEIALFMHGLQGQQHILQQTADFLFS